MLKIPIFNSVIMLSPSTVRIAKSRRVRRAEHLILRPRMEFHLHDPIHFHGLVPKYKRRLNLFE
jgi:hypothetical protein